MTTTRSIPTTPAYRRALASEPGLCAVARVVRILAAAGYDGADTYGTILKPLTFPLVGWQRGIHFHAHNPEDMPPRVGLVCAADFPDPIITSADPATEEEDWLRTQEAYDAVTDVWLDYLDGVVRVPGGAA